MVKVIRNAITKETCEFISLNMDLLFHLVDYPKDEYVSNSTGYYAPIFLESLLIHLQPLIEKTVSKKLYPSYSYGRIYYNKSILEKHKDRPPSEYGVSLCISKDTDWTIYFEEDGKAIPYNLNETDMIVYKGMEYNHWRESYQGNKHTQVFLMYVDVDGKYSDWKWDKREGLGHKRVMCS